MNVAVQNQKVTVQEALDRCLEELAAGGSTIEQCVARFPEYAAELRPLLKTAERLEMVGEVRPSRAFKSRLRKQLAGEEQNSRIALSWRVLLLLAVILVVGASLAIWMSYNLSAIGGSVLPFPPLT